MCENGSNGSVALGVIDNPNANHKGKKRSPNKKRWVFTWFNFNDIDVVNMADQIEKMGKYVMGIEECPSTGKAHIQGYVRFDKCIRAIEKWPHISWAGAKGDDRQNYDYCTKEGKVLTNMKKPAEVRVDKRIVDFKPRIWQKRLIKYLEEEPDDRSILWVYDLDGGKGKTIFSKYYYSTYEESTVIVSTNKSSDLVTCIHDRLRVFLLDLPRCCDAQFTPYNAIEQIKNGFVTDGKLKKRAEVHVFAPPHVVIFSNHYPDATKFSNDRLILWDLSEAGS